MIVKALAFGFAGLVATGCVWERNVDKRLARVQLGVNSRQLSTPVAADKPRYNIARVTQPTTTLPEPTPTEQASSGVTGSLQFTMRYPRNNVPIYMGAEVEAGPLENQGYLGGAYGVIGAEASSGRGSLSVEMTGGRRWLRSELNAENVPSFMLEPRVRAQLTLTPQVTVGGVIGANAMPDERGWMAGVYIGMFSAPIDGSR